MKKDRKEISIGERKQSITRVQFPIVPAEAITVHKAQGQTRESVCVEIPTRAIERPSLHVALSRVTKLSELYIIGSFRPPNPPRVDDDVMLELKRLRNEKALEICFDTLEMKSGIVIAYQMFHHYTHIAIIS